MIEKLFQTNTDAIWLILRLTLGLVMLPHGLQKLFGWFGGFGFAPTMQFFGAQGIPAIIAFLVIMAESLGALFLIFGLGTRFCAASLVLVMLGAAYFQRANGLFMNWFGNQAGEGFEYHILAIGIALALTIYGGGLASLDRLIQTRLLPSV